MPKNDCPCHKCTKHEESCHAGCKKYTDWRKELDAENEAARTKIIVDQFIIVNTMKIKRKRNLRRKDNGCV